jgi:tRNA uridine 5-carboxymethylaminomethyl modification enzyme
VPGLVLAGQVLGTSGYEEAAVLGFIAGVNAILTSRGEAPVIPGREAAYAGVLVDDLVTREHVEPYRMFTSRAEHRLLLGVDSARERLMATGVRLGLVREEMFHVERRRWERRRAACSVLEETALNPDQETRRVLREVVGIELKTPTSWAGVLRRQDVDAARVAEVIPAIAGLSDEDRGIVVGALRYRGYLTRQQREAERVRRLREVAIPASFAPARLPGLSREIVEQLERHRPSTLAEAEGLPGMTPAAVAILAGHLARGMGRP